jgi:hypothetical protein
MALVVMSFRFPSGVATKYTWPGSTDDEFETAPVE